MLSLADEVTQHMTASGGKILLRLPSGTLPQRTSHDWLRSGLPTVRSCESCKSSTIGLVLFENRQARREWPLQQDSALSSLREACRDQLRGGSTGLLFRYNGITTDLNPLLALPHGQSPNELIPAAYLQNWIPHPRRGTAHSPWASLPFPAALDSSCVQVRNKATKSGHHSPTLLKGLGHLDPRGSQFCL